MREIIYGKKYLNALQPFLLYVKYLKSEFQPGVLSHTNQDSKLNITNKDIL